MINARRRTTRKATLVTQGWPLGLAWLEFLALLAVLGFVLLRTRR